jgi:hypothetical protein
VTRADIQRAVLAGVAVFDRAGLAFTGKASIVDAREAIGANVSAGTAVLRIVLQIRGFDGASAFAVGTASDGEWNC